jgi:hypothetical protein
MAEAIIQMVKDRQTKANMIKKSYLHAYLDFPRKAEQGSTETPVLFPNKADKR